MGFRWLAVGLLLLAPVSAAYAAGPRIVLNLQVLVPVDEQGLPGEARLADKLPEQPDAMVRKRIAGLRFAPATRGGEPVPSELSLSVALTATRMGEQVDYVIGKITPAPIVRQMPRYPLDAIRLGYGGAVMMKVTLAPEPGADRMQVEVLAVEVKPGRAGRYRKDFEKAALDSLAGCCALAETIDGQPVSLVAFVPVSFSVNWTRHRIDPDDFKQRWAGEASDLPDGLARATLLEASSQAP